MQQPFLSFNKVTTGYQSDHPVITDLNFELKEGELACLLGPSGCGKTTILKAICGFQDIHQGQIVLGDRVLSTQNKSIPPEQRNVGMVFQDHALFPHLTIAKNIGFGLQNLKKPDAEKQVEKMLDLVGMRDFRDVYPHEISGGQSQRVAIARALAPQPSLLLMDEPFSNLDTSLRESLGYEVRQLLKDAQMTAIMVTHDQHDAFALGDSVGVLANGQLQQWGSPFDLYHTPINKFVANFIGEGVFIDGFVKSTSSITTSFGEISGQVMNTDLITKQVKLLLRPDDVRQTGNDSIVGLVKRKAFRGAQTLYTIETNTGESLMSLLPSHKDYKLNEKIQVSVDADHLVVFAKD